jgi:NTP pyrophosphatase (non-canonical NTP hydrolase)
MSDAQTTVAELRGIQRRFVEERDWQPFHCPKNLVMGLSVEVAELMEHFLWVDGPASYEVVRHEDKRTALADELADIAGHVFNLCDVLGIDLSEAIRAKMVKNAVKYPAEAYRGKNRP